MAVQSGGALQKRKAKRNILLNFTFHDKGIKLANIQPDVCLIIQTNCFPVGEQPVIAEGLLDFPQDLAQVFEGVRLVGIRPEQRTERFTPVLAFLSGKISQQRQRLTTGEADRSLIQIKLWGTQKVQGKTGGHASPLLFSSR